MGFKNYSFRKPRSELVKEIFKLLIVAGLICVAASSPCFVNNVLKSYKKWKKYSKKKVDSTFYNLKKQGLINIKQKDNQILISLSRKGERKAKLFQIDNIEIKRPDKWDGKWRLVIFDIAQLKKIYREAFRKKLKELGFYPYQKSVWLYPFNCQKEIDLLKNFFELTGKEVKLVVAEDIGQDKFFKEVFNLP